MERGTERQRGADGEVVVEEHGSPERPWGEAEVLALVSVWDEVGAKPGAESRSTFELISERLRRLSVARGWRECQAKSRSLGLQSRRGDAAAGTSAGFAPGLDGRPVEAIYISSVSVPMNEGKSGVTTNRSTA